MYLVDSLNFSFCKYIGFVFTIGSASWERNMKFPSEDGRKNSKSEDTASPDSDNSELSNCSCKSGDY